MTKKLMKAIYAISGDPPTWGHADIMQRAAKKFDQVYWVLGNNPKKNYRYCMETRTKMMKIYTWYYKLNNVQIISIDGSIAKWAKENKVQFLIRGLRSSSDFQYEFELSVGNRGINKNLETICMFTKPHYATISSSLVREISSLDEKIGQYVHPDVEKIIIQEKNKN